MFWARTIGLVRTRLNKNNTYRNDRNEYVRVKCSEDKLTKCDSQNVKRGICHVRTRFSVCRKSIHYA